MLKSYDKVLDNAAWIKTCNNIQRNYRYNKSKNILFPWRRSSLRFQKRLTRKTYFRYYSGRLWNYFFWLSPCSSSRSWTNCSRYMWFSIAVCSLSNLPDSKKILTDFSSIGHSSGTDTLCGIAYIFQNLHYLI